MPLWSGFSADLSGGQGRDGTGFLVSTAGALEWVAEGDSFAVAALSGKTGEVLLAVHEGKCLVQTFDEAGVQQSIEEVDLIARTRRVVLPAADRTHRFLRPFDGSAILIWEEGPQVLERQGQGFKLVELLAGMVQLTPAPEGSGLRALGLLRTAEGPKIVALDEHFQEIEGAGRELAREGFQDIRHARLVADQQGLLLVESETGRYLLTGKAPSFEIIAAGLPPVPAGLAERLTKSATGPGAIVHEDGSAIIVSRPDGGVFTARFELPPLAEVGPESDTGLTRLVGVDPPLGRALGEGAQALHLVRAALSIPNRQEMLLVQEASHRIQGLHGPSGVRRMPAELAAGIEQGGMLVRAGETVLGILAGEGKGLLLAGPDGPAQRIEGLPGRPDRLALACNGRRLALSYGARLLLLGREQEGPWRILEDQDQSARPAILLLRFDHGQDSLAALHGDGTWTRLAGALGETPPTPPVCIDELFGTLTDFLIDGSGGRFFATWLGPYAVQCSDLSTGNLLWEAHAVRTERLELRGEELVLWSTEGASQALRRAATGEVLLDLGTAPRRFLEADGQVALLTGRTLVSAPTGHLGDPQKRRFTLLSRTMAHGGARVDEAENELVFDQVLQGSLCLPDGDTWRTFIGATGAEGARTVLELPALGLDRGADLSLGLHFEQAAAFKQWELAEVLGEAPTWARVRLTHGPWRTDPIVLFVR